MKTVALNGAVSSNLTLGALKKTYKGELTMGITCKPVGKMVSMLRKLDNEQAKEKAAVKKEKPAKK